MKKIIVLMLSGLLIIALIGCASTVLIPRWPNRVKAGVRLGTPPPLGPIEIKNGDPINTQKTVALVNGVRESGLTRIGPARVWTDYRAWTDLIMERLEAELRKRGVRSGTPANHVLKVSVTSITVADAAGGNATVYVSVEKADGWAKTYKGYYSLYLDMSRKNPEITRKLSKMRQEPPYAISCLPTEGHDPCMAVYLAVEEIINDPVFREALK